LAAGSYPGVLDDVTTIDYSDWLVVGSASIPDELAYRIVKAAAENAAGWNRQSPNLKPEESGAFGNLEADPEVQWKNLGISLHPGAERYYREMGYIE
jgi:TRAP-type uncharacterized transport system substrate-binding protein